MFEDEQFVEEVTFQASKWVLSMKLEKLMKHTEDIIYSGKYLHRPDV